MAELPQIHPKLLKRIRSYMPRSNMLGILLDKRGVFGWSSLAPAPSVFVADDEMSSGRCHDGRRHGGMVQYACALEDIRFQIHQFTLLFFGYAHESLLVFST